MRVQAMMPFSEEELRYIENLDAAHDVSLLQRELPSLRAESLRTLQVATALLKRCAAAGLNLSEIGTIISRPLVGLDEEPSDLEKLCTAAREAVDNALLVSDNEDDEEDDGGAAQDSDEDMATSTVADVGGGGGAHSSTGRLSGAVSLDSGLLMQQHSFNSRGSDSMESSPVRSAVDMVHRAEDLLFALDEEHSTTFGSSRSMDPLASGISVPGSSTTRHTLLQSGLHQSSSFESDYSSASLVVEQAFRGPCPPAVVPGKWRGVQLAAVQSSYESEGLPMGPGAQLMAASVDPSHRLMKDFTKGKRQPGRKGHRAHRLKKSVRVCHFV